jgi:hypothetical protein
LAGDLITGPEILYESEEIAFKGGPEMSGYVYVQYFLSDKGRIEAFKKDKSAERDQEEVITDPNKRGSSPKSVHGN